MKIKKEKTTFHSVAFSRKVKEQIAQELDGKSFEQQKEIIRKFLSGELKLKAVR